MSLNTEKADFRICIRGGGDIATGVAWRLHSCGFNLLITEIEQPLAVRRKVAFCEAVYEGRARVEGVEAELVGDVREVAPLWDKGRIPLMVDPDCREAFSVQPDALVDVILAKKNSGTDLSSAPVVIGVGPGFEAGKDAHFVVESKRGHYLGRLLTSGRAEEDTGQPGAVLGFTSERVLRAPDEGIWQSTMEIGALVEEGAPIGSVSGLPVEAGISGALRGLIRPGIPVKKGLKIGDIDPRGIPDHCFTISDKALAIAGGVLEGILRGLPDQPRSSMGT